MDQIDVDNAKNVTITVEVNGQRVHFERAGATGHQIKDAAIGQGVPIQLDFALLKELPNGESKHVGDHEEEHLHDHMRFIAKAQEVKITVEVNSRPVHFDTKRATGRQIIEAAIAQGVSIQPNFVLQKELPNGESKVVGPHEEEHLHDHMQFTAIAPDDNS